MENIGTTYLVLHFFYQKKKSHLYFLPNSFTVFNLDCPYPKKLSFALYKSVIITSLEAGLYPYPDGKFLSSSQPLAPGLKCSST